MSLVLVLLAVVAAWAHEVRVVMLDVGQGDSVLLTFGGPEDAKHVLIDAGSPYADVAGQLARSGVTRLDLVVSTHAHADHIGGARAVLQTLPTRYYLDNGLPFPTQTYGELAATVATSGAQVLGRAGAPFRQARFAPDATLTLLSPLPGEQHAGTRSDQNANSIVLRLDHGEDCFLFMGDAEAPTERVLVERGLGPCDVLKVGHHGSDTASSDLLLAAVRPQLALVSVGAVNAYDHPGAGALERLARAGAKVLRTDRDGAITVVSLGDGGLRYTRSGPRPIASEPARGVHVVDPPDDPSAPCPYPASRNSEVFHEAGCGMADRIYPSNLVCYPSEPEALAAGRRPGQCCH